MTADNQTQPKAQNPGQPNAGKPNDLGNKPGSSYDPSKTTSGTGFNPSKPQSGRPEDEPEQGSKTDSYSKKGA